MLIPVRAIVAAVVILALAPPAIAQQAGKTYRIGYISNRDKVEYREEALRQGLRELGYVEGQNLVIEWRFASGQRHLLGEFAAELVGLDVDLIVTSGLGSARAAKKATSTIPIPVVIANIYDPVRSGIVTSLARPGGNITGFTTLSVGIAGKLLELLKDAVPNLSQVALILEQGHPGSPSFIEESQVAARTMGVRLQILEAGDPNDFENVYHTAKQGGADAVVVRGTGLMHRNIGRIINLEIENKLPVIHTERRFVLAGGLMSFGPDRVDPYRRAATYVDRILKGAKPSNLPIEQPDRFDLTINLKTAKEVGIKIPHTLLFRANKVIE
jgi:putative ABC transport system substrate-binding protein